MAIYSFASSSREISCRPQRAQRSAQQPHPGSFPLRQPEDGTQKPPGGGNITRNVRDENSKSCGNLNTPRGQRCSGLFCMVLARKTQGGCHFQRSCAVTCAVNLLRSSAVQSALELSRVRFPQARGFSIVGLSVCRLVFWSALLLQIDWSC